MTHYIDRIWLYSSFYGEQLRISLQLHEEGYTFVVLTSGTKTLVIGMNDVEDTQAIYDTMLEKIGE